MAEGRYADELGPLEPPPRADGRQRGHSGQWGLASLLLSMLVIAVIPLLIILEIVGMFVVGIMVQEGRGGVQFQDTGAILTGIYVVVYGLVGIAVFALLFGVAGVVSGLVRKQPLGLSVAGTLLSLVSVALSVVILVVTIKAAGFTREMVGERRGMPAKWR